MPIAAPPTPSPHHPHAGLAADAYRRLIAAVGLGDVEIQRLNVRMLAALDTDPDLTFNIADVYGTDPEAARRLVEAATSLQAEAFPRVLATLP